MDFDKKPELIYVQWTNNYGGLEKITQIYEKIFTEYNIKVLTLRYNKEGIMYKLGIIPKYHKRRFLLYFEYFSFVRKNKDAIYHLQYPGSRILLLTYLGKATKIIFHFHGTKFRVNFFDKAVWKLLKNRVTVIANSNHTKSIVMSRLPMARTPVVIPNLINHNDFSYTRRCINDKFIITYAGRFTSGKNLNIIIETARILNKENVEFHLYGEGPEKESLSNMIKSYGVESFVFLHSFSQHITRVYDRSNLFLFLSLYESFGNVVAEAILTGLPVICNKIPSLQEFINEETFFIDELEPLSISKKIKYFIDNYHQILDLLEPITENVRKYLDNEKIVYSIASVYKTLER